MQLVAWEPSTARGQEVGSRGHPVGSRYCLHFVHHVYTASCFTSPHTPYMPFGRSSVAPTSHKHYCLPTAPQYVRSCPNSAHHTVPWHIFVFNPKKPDWVYEEIKCRLLSGNAFYHLVQNVLSSPWLFQYIHVKIYWYIIWPVVLHRHGTESVRLKEEQWLKGVWK
jgi:hypothetical protein